VGGWVCCVLLKQAWSVIFLSEEIRWSQKLFRNAIIDSEEMLIHVSHRDWILMIAERFSK
jgi:hypothetical protein